MSFNPTGVGSSLPSAAGFPAFPFQPICYLGRLTQICFSFVEKNLPTSKYCPTDLKPSSPRPKPSLALTAIPTPTGLASTASTGIPVLRTLGMGTNIHWDKPQTLGRSWARGRSSCPTNPGCGAGEGDDES